MPNYKATLFFQTQSLAQAPLVAQGWSETYYTVQSGPDGAQTAVQDIAQRRRGIMVGPNQMIAFRVSDEAIRKDSALFSGPYASLYPDKTVYSDTPWQAQLCRLANGMLYWRPLYLRGIPDDAYDPEGLEQGGTAWFQAVDSFLFYLTNAPWFIKVISKDPSIPSVPILGIIENPVGTLAVTSGGAHGLAVGDQVKIYNLRGAGPQGTKRVKSVPDAFSFSVSGELPVGFVYTGTAFSKKIVTAYVKIDGANRERITHRIVGRPFAQQRGRRRV